MITEAEKSGRVFEVGAVYIATPAIKGRPKRLAAVVGVEGQTVQAAFVDELAVGMLEAFDGREIATINTQTGRYNISSYVRAAAADAAIVSDILKAKGKAVA